MFSVSRLRLAVALGMVALCFDALGSDSVGTSGEAPVFASRKSSRWQDRASEFVQRTPNLLLREGNKKIPPSRVGHVYKMERAEGEDLLLSNRTTSLQGWAPAIDVVRLNEAEAFFSQQILVNPHSSFAHLMRAIVRHENDDPDCALADVDEKT